MFVPEPVRARGLEAIADGSFAAWAGTRFETVAGPLWQNQMVHKWGNQQTAYFDPDATPGTFANTTAEYERAAAALDRFAAVGLFEHFWVSVCLILHTLELSAEFWRRCTAGAPALPVVNAGRGNITSFRRDFPGLADRHLSVA